MKYQISPVNWEILNKILIVYICKRLGVMSFTCTVYGAATWQYLSKL